MAYIIAANVKAYAGISGAGDDALLASLITRAQAVIDRYCNRTFEAASASTRYFTVGRDTEGAWLWFDEDIASITTVTNGDSVAVSSSQYTTEPKNRTPYHGIKLLGSAGKVWTYSTDPEDAISVVGKWAYSTSAPEDIQHAAIRLVTFFYRQKDTSQDSDRPLLTESGVTLLPLQIPTDVRHMLNPYRWL